MYIYVYGNHWWLSCIESDCETVDAGLVPGSERPPLDKEMAVQSSILAWEIPRTEEPGGL